jgi:hypothetical protein
MREFRVLSVVVVLLFFLISCENKDKDQAECITAFDCEEGWLCLEGKCVDPNAGADEDSSIILPDDKEIPDPDSGVIGEDVDMIEETDDESVVLPDFDTEEHPDTVHDPDVVLDIEVDEDNIDADTVDEDIIIAFCGDGIPEGLEECDLGTLLNTGAYGGCKSDCTLAIRCGDGLKNGPEFCDSGDNNGLYGFCNSTCTAAGERCNDGIINGPEFCDDGSINNGKYGYCNSFCTALGLRCGDGYINGPVGGPVEECDKGTDNGKTACVYGQLSCKVCDTLCIEHDGTVEYCGDDVKNGTEDCDDGLDNGKYGYCNSTCTGINNCGDSVVTAPEVCDKNTIACNAISGMGYNNTDVVSCNGDCNAWLTSTCTCASGYEKDGTQKCVDTNECAEGNELLNNCHDNANCNNTSGSFNCTCKTNYSGDGVANCTPDTKVNQACTGLPGNGFWNTATSINQTWNGTVWYPPVSGTYNETSSTTECRFACNINYGWNGSTCAADTRTNQSCTGLPSNAVWNTASSIIQTWNGANWLPSTAGTYNTTSSTTECRYKCDTNYSWNSSACVADTKTNQACTGLPVNGAWNTVSHISQTWNGSIWYPSTTGAYNTTSSTTECRFVCGTNYTWNGLTCAADTKPAQNCTGLPSNAVWNTASSITQTWNGTAWVPSTAGAYNMTSSTTECRYKCDTNYSWNSSACVADTRTNQSCTGLPTNASWNTVATITQTWNGGAWVPSTAGGYNETSSTTECRYKCGTNYTWNGIICAADIRYDQNCTGLPSNAVWNTVSSINQTWNGSTWLPTLTGTYNETGSTSECRYKCAVDYHWEGGSCISNTRTGQTCSAKPANTDWNTVSSISQTWNGSTWVPSTTSVYNETSSTTECRYKCSSDYHLDGGSCVSNTRTGQTCTGNPANSDWNTATSITQTWNGSAWTPSTAGTYNTTGSTTECYFQCKANYNWNNPNCVAATQTASCSAKPANTDWNDSGKNGTYTQTWNGTTWAPTTSTTYNATAGDCRYICSSGYHWETSTCVSNTRTDQACSAKPSNTDWNTVSSITQTWSGGVWSPTTTSSYNESASTTNCYYKCVSGYHLDGGSCISDTRSGQACSAKPSNTDWNTVSSITQTWSGGVWSPATTSSYNETGSTTECRYKCSSDFYWKSSSSTCVECTDNTHCSDEPGELYCNTANNTCVQCLVDGDCSAGYVCNSSKQCEVYNPCGGTGWTYNSSTGKCYKYVSTAATWTAARDACAGESARLVDLSNATENQYVASLMPDNGHAWIGLNDYPVAVTANGGNPTCGTPEGINSRGGVYYGTNSSNQKINETCGVSDMPGYDEYFRLTTLAGYNGIWTFKVYPVSSSHDFSLFIDSNCTSYLSCTDSGGNGSIETLTYNASASSVYYIYVDSWSTTARDYYIEFLPPSSKLPVLPSGQLRSFNWVGNQITYDNSAFVNFLSPSEPNFNSPGSGSDSKYREVRCVGQQKYSGATNGATWYDDPCTLTKPYVCEK